MKKGQTTILLDMDIITSSEWIKLIQERKASQLINDLLRTALKIQKYEMPKEISDIDNELQAIKIKEALLEQKKLDIKKELDKEDWRNWKSPHLT